MPPPEKPKDFIQRKLEECIDLINVGKDHTQIVFTYSIQDTFIRGPNNVLLPVKRIQVELNESMYQEIVDKK